MKCGASIIGNLSKTKQINGFLTNQQNITGKLTAPIKISGIITIPIDLGEAYEQYDKDVTNIIPSFETQIFNTKEKVLKEDVVISQIQIYETSNIFGGTTLII